jgi:hypothetical protein
MCSKILETKSIRTLEDEIAIQAVSIGHKVFMILHDISPGCLLDWAFGEEDDFHYIPITVKDHIWHPFHHSENS